MLLIVGYVVAGWTFGDPHFQTLDGKQYTFNGLGEYIVVKTGGYKFVLQGRTALVDDSTATVFSAFVAAQLTESGNVSEAELASTVLHAELTSYNELMVLVCCYQDTDNVTALPINAKFNNAYWRNITDKFASLDDTTQIVLDSASVTRPSNKSLVVSFSSGVSVKIEIKTRLLVAVWAVPETFKGDTSGLLGVWDDDINNDFTSRNGNVISIDSTDRDIHTLFAQTCKFVSLLCSIFVALFVLQGK